MDDPSSRPVLYVGCPMWANRDWIGRGLPADTRPGRELAAYARVCNAVEGNTTFYAVPRPDTVRRWSELTPESFRFAFKLPREVTHVRRLRHCDAEVAAFLDALAPLGPRLGPLSVQLPATFGPGDLPVLDAFLGRVSREHHWATEVRHPAFADGGPVERALNDLLFARGADRVVLDSRPLFAGPSATQEEIETKRRKPRLPVRAVALGRHPIVRFIGQTAPDANPPLWTRWTRTVARWLGDGRHPFFFVHTPDNVASLGLARRFHAEVAAAGPRLDPLPGGDAPSPLW